ncbi:TPA: hypothetical protein DIC39_02470 [Patescibacteria group bacterium]|nr:MAG: hypothetical protein UX54_C0030G0012 [Parcubacteria group bacterium GW2011_GWA2_46_39]HBV33084.1 hypothetical protein [Patescibacteria group bacterium]HCU47897.1 hypothetical protein [Patescibacteria group bacterium]
MSTVSVPLTPKLEEAVINLVKSGLGANKADIIRKAITSFAEEQAVQAVLRSEQEAREGKVLKGDLRKLVKRMVI